MASLVATFGMNDSGTFSDSTSTRAEDMYFFGRRKIAATKRRRTAVPGNSTSRGRRSGACRKWRSWLQWKESSPPSR